MIDFFRRLFAPARLECDGKRAAALGADDRSLELAPDMIESMKRDLVDVIGRYVEVDREKIEVNFERQDRALAMLANIPIISVNRPNGNGARVTLEPAALPRRARFRKTSQRRRPQPPSAVANAAVAQAA